MSRLSRSNSNRKLESLEARQLMAVDPFDGLMNIGLDQHTIDDSFPAIEHHSTIPEFDHHRQADFWIDGDDTYYQTGDIEQTLDDAHDLTGLDSVRDTYGFSGTGQTVVVIDSGIAYDHYALGGGFGANYRVVGGWDFAENDSNPYDDGPQGSHGTHVAGIIGGTGDTYGRDVGVAPGVDLVALRVFEDDGDGYFSYISGALDWVIANHDSFDNPITAINLSIGTTWNSDTPPSWAGSLEAKFQQIENLGIFISVSAGNSFTSYNETGLSYPAASDYVVPVMSVDDGGNLSYFSQRHSSAIAAPGRTIRSTIPDYAGNNNGQVDDWANFSGTSMAAPYVAGASVLIREAMELVGYTNITQDSIYNHMVSTADQIYDSATSQFYNRLNVSAAIEALMPQDDFGDSAGQAHSWGTLGEGTFEQSGMISSLTDGDYFTFTAATTGTATFSADVTNDLSLTWDFGSENATQVGGNWSIDVIAGQSYTVGLSTDDGLGFFDMDVNIESTFTFTDWGSITGQSQYAGLSNSGETWYRIVAGQDGYATAQATFANAAGNVDLALYDASMQLLDESNGSSGAEQVDYLATAGEEFYIRVTGTNADIDFQLTNMVDISGSTLNVTGTAGADSFTFTAGSIHQVTINGVDYQFDSAAITAVSFDGGDGSDTASFIGSTNDDTVVFYAGSVVMVGSNYTASAVDVEHIVVDGGGGTDQAILHGTSGDDTFSTWSDRAFLKGSGYFNQVINFDTTVAYGYDGNDISVFRGTDGDETYSTWTDRAYIQGADFFYQARGFERTDAYAFGGNDTAIFRGSNGNDLYSTWSDRAFIQGDGFFHQARGFDRTDAYAYGGNDQVIFRGTNGDETYSTWSDRAFIEGDGFFHQARDFDATVAYAYGGNDTTIFRGTNGDELYSTWSDRAFIQGDDFFHQARDFDTTVAYAYGGNDISIFRGTSGDEIYSTWSDRAFIQGSGFFHQARDFDRTDAYANGGDDRAIFRGSDGDDTYSTWSERAFIQGSGFFHQARDFYRSDAWAFGGTDHVIFRGTAGDETYATWDDRAYIQGASFFHQARDFDSTLAYGNGGNDQAILNGSSGNDIYMAWSNRALIEGSSYRHDARDFATTQAFANGGANDQAILHDSSENDEVVADSWGAFVTNGTYRNEAHGFDEIEANQSLGGEDDASISSIDYLFELIGEWNQG